MDEITKQYNQYLAQIEMVLHPNLYGAFLKIHNTILENEIRKARRF